MNAARAVAVKTALIHSCLCQNIRVYSQNIGHCHKCCDTRKNLGFDICVVFFQVKNFVKIHKFSLPFLFLTQNYVHKSTIRYIMPGVNSFFTKF